MRREIVAGLACAALLGCGERATQRSAGTDAGTPADSATWISPETTERRCGAQPETDCAIDVGERVPLEAVGTTAGGPDQYGGAGCGLGGGDAIEDVAFRWTAPLAGTYLISTEGSVFDTLLSIRGGSCTGRELACNDDMGAEVPQSAVLLDLLDCETVTIVVDGTSVDATGAFRLTIAGFERWCGDGVDNDGDSVSDCEDTDCAELPPCGWPSAWSATETAVLDEVNARRAMGATCDGVTMPPVPPLAIDDHLRLAARLHSLDMADNDYLSQDSADGRTQDTRLAEAGFAGEGPLGENIVAHESRAREAVDQWMSSPAACVNVMRAEFHVTGIGYAQGSSGSRLTQDFAGGS